MAVPAPTPAAAEKPRSGKGKKRKDDKSVDLVITLPKPVRKRLKTKAGELSMTPEEVAAHVVQMWVDG